MSKKNQELLKLALSYDEEFQQLNMENVVDFTLEQIKSLVLTDDNRLNNIRMSYLINNVTINKDLLLIIKYIAINGKTTLHDVKELLLTINNIKGISNQYKDDHLNLIKSIVHMQPQVQYIDEILEFCLDNVKLSYAINSIFFDSFEYKDGKIAANKYSEKVVRAALNRNNTLYLNIHTNKEFVKHYAYVYKEYSNSLIDCIIDESILNSCFPLHAFIDHIDCSILKLKGISNVCTFIDHARKSGLQITTLRNIIKDQFTIDECIDIIINNSEDMNRNAKHVFYGIVIDFVRDGNLNKCSDLLKTLLYKFIDVHYSYDDGRIELLNILNGQVVVKKPTPPVSVVEKMSVKDINELSKSDLDKLYTDFNNSGYKDNQANQLKILYSMLEYCIYDSSSKYKEYIKNWLSYSIDNLDNLTIRPTYNIVLSHTSTKKSFMELIISIDNRTAKHYVKYLL